MKRIFMACCTLMAAGLASLVSAEDPVPEEGPGWTGLTSPQDVIAARQALMLAIEDLMQPIDTHTADGEGEPAALAAAADTIAAMLLATPHLFPPTTNLYDPEAELPATLALPAIWDNFPAFYEMAMIASSTATTMAETAAATELRIAGLSLRGSCDACHALYLRPYVRSGVTEEDLEFDFDAVFDEN